MNFTFATGTMATLDEKITSLEAKIAAYEVQLQNSTTNEGKNRLSNLIISTRETLNLLLKAQGNRNVLISYLFPITTLHFTYFTMNLFQS